MTRKLIIHNTFLHQYSDQLGVTPPAYTVSAQHTKLCSVLYLFPFKPSSLSSPKFTIPSCPTLLSQTTAQSQNIRAWFASLQTVPHYTARQRAKQAVPVAIKSSLAAGDDLSLPAHQWNLPSVTPTVTYPSAKVPHSYLVPQGLGFLT